MVRGIDSAAIVPRRGSVICHTERISSSMASNFLIDFIQFVDQQHAGLLRENRLQQRTRDKEVE